MENERDLYNEAAQEAVELANRLADRNPEADLWDIADGLLAGAVHYWLFSRQPCENPMCEECMPISSVEQRIAELLRLTEQLAEESEYYNTPHDTTVGQA